jgi:prepilin-type N-terminal cleavage/methylation domain-containing protein/prepilin-type processing-associated H-X9-DG protein
MKETLLHHPGNRNTDPQVAAFTLTELLVVLAVLAVLVCLACPALAGSKLQSKQAQCAGNLRQLALAHLNSAADASDRLPSQTGGNWLWDTSTSLTDTLIAHGATRNSMYCPGFPAQNNDTLWNFGGVFRVIGYALTVPGTTTLLASNVNPSIQPQFVRLGPATLGLPSPASRALVADATISAAGQNSTNPVTQASYNYTAIQGGWSQPHRAAHMATVTPAGGNVGMLDGHVEWRPFRQMTARTGPGVSAAPIFWW